MIWVAIVAVIIIYLTATKPAESFVPFGFFFVFVPLAFLFYMSPRRATSLVQEVQAKTTLELADQQQDLVLERRNIAEVQIESLKIRLLAKSGEWYFFAMGSRNYPGGLSRTQIERLLALLQKFCSEDPPIPMFIKNKRQWTTIQR